jgi:hypothetical protein
MPIISRALKLAKRQPQTLLIFKEKILAFLSQNPKQSFTIGDIAKTIELTDEIIYVFQNLRTLVSQLKSQGSKNH